MNNKKCEEKLVKVRCKKISKSKTTTAKAAATSAAAGHPLKQLQIAEWDHSKDYKFLKDFKRDYKHLLCLLKCHISEEQERVARNEQELDELKRKFNNMQVEDAELKRKRWCRYCEAEATYQSNAGPYLYCSTECEEYYNSLMNGVGSINSKFNFSLQNSSSP